MTPEGRPETVAELNTLSTLALSQASHAHAVLWSAITSSLMAKGLIEHSDLAVKISEIANDQPEAIRVSPIFQSIVSPAMEALVLCEYPTLADAPEWVRKMVRGEVVARTAEPVSPGSFIGAEGPSGERA